MPCTGHMQNTTSTNRKHLFAAACAVILVPTLLTACSGGASDDRTASDQASGAGATLASCMREQGYDMADPSASGGGTALAAPDGVDAEQWGADLQACLGEVRADDGAGDGVQAAQPAGTPEQRQEVAECIRENGFTDYPDDEDAMATFTPDDEEAFRDASSTCYDEAFGSEYRSGTSAGK